MTLLSAMKKIPVYCAPIEIQPLIGCELEPLEIAGAAVRCYIPAVDTDGAINCLKNKLNAMTMRLVSIEWCVDYDNTEWETPNNETEDNYVAEARDTGEIIFDSFHTWGHDTLHRS